MNKYEGRDNVSQILRRHLLQALKESLKTEGFEQIELDPIVVNISLKKACYILQDVAVDEEIMAMMRMDGRMFTFGIAEIGQGKCSIMPKLVRTDNGSQEEKIRELTESELEGLGTHPVDPGFMEGTTTSTHAERMMSHNCFQLHRDIDKEDTEKTATPGMSMEQVSADTATPMFNGIGDAINDTSMDAADGSEFAGDGMATVTASSNTDAICQFFQTCCSCGPNITADVEGPGAFTCEIRPPSKLTSTVENIDMTE